MSSELRLRLALRQYAPLILGCLLVGVAALVGAAELLGPQYRTSSQVIVTDPNLRSLLTGSSVADSDRQSQGATAAVLASSPGFFQYVAQDLHESDWRAIQGEVEVSQSGTTSVISFTVDAASADRAVSLADALARDFPSFKTAIDLAPVRQVLLAAQRQAAADPANALLRASVARLRLLATATTGGVAVGRAGSAERTRPVIGRSILEGATVGLVVGLLLMGLAEALRVQPPSGGEPRPQSEPQPGAEPR
jgi:capsular polysaccharide biosynthesis protein